MRHIRAKSYRRQPWKNGGGETIEIAVSPAGAGIDDFDWRVSMARVEADGPFSAFPEIDRTLTILEGEGIELTLEGQPPVRIQGEPHAFPGDVATQARLLDGPITDLNVMTRRGRLTHRVAADLCRLASSILSSALRQHCSIAIAARCRSETNTPTRSSLRPATAC